MRQDRDRFFGFTRPFVKQFGVIVEELELICRLELFQGDAEMGEMLFSCFSRVGGFRGCPSGMVQAVEKIDRFLQSVRRGLTEWRR